MYPSFCRLAIGNKQEDNGTDLADEMKERKLKLSGNSLGHSISDEEFKTLVEQIDEDKFQSLVTDIVETTDTLESSHLESTVSLFMVLLDTDTNAVQAAKNAIETSFDQTTTLGTLGRFLMLLLENEISNIRSEVGGSYAIPTDSHPIVLPATEMPQRLGSNSSSVGAPASFEQIRARMDSLGRKLEENPRVKRCVLALWCRALSLVGSRSSKGVQTTLVLITDKEGNIETRLQELEDTTTGRFRNTTQHAKYAIEIATEALGEEWTTDGPSIRQNQNTSDISIEKYSFLLDKVKNPLDACAKRVLHNMTSDRNANNDLGYRQFRAQIENWFTNTDSEAVKSAITQLACSEILASRILQIEADNTKALASRRYNALYGSVDLLIQREELDRKETVRTSAIVSFLQGISPENVKPTDLAAVKKEKKKALEEIENAIKLVELYTPTERRLFKCKLAQPSSDPGYVPCLLSENEYEKTYVEETKAGMRVVPLTTRIALAAACRFLCVMHFKGSKAALLTCKIEGQEVYLHEYLSLCVQNDTTKEQTLSRTCASIVLNFLKRERPDNGTFDLKQTSIISPSESQLTDFLKTVILKYYDAVPFARTLDGFFEAPASRLSLNSTLFPEAMVESILSSVLVASVDSGLRKSNLDSVIVFVNRYNHHGVKNEDKRTARSVENHIRASIGLFTPEIVKVSLSTGSFVGFAVPAGTFAIAYLLPWFTLFFYIFIPLFCFSLKKKLQGSDIMTSEAFTFARTVRILKEYATVDYFKKLVLYGTGAAVTYKRIEALKAICDNILEWMPNIFNYAGYIESTLTVLNENRRNTLPPSGAILKYLSKASMGDSEVSYFDLIHNEHVYSPNAAYRLLALHFGMDTTYVCLTARPQEMLCPVQMSKKNLLLYLPHALWALTYDATNGYFNESKSDDAFESMGQMSLVVSYVASIILSCVGLQGLRLTTWGCKLYTTVSFVCKRLFYEGTIPSVASASDIAANFRNYTYIGLVDAIFNDDIKSGRARLRSNKGNTYSLSDEGLELVFQQGLEQIKAVRRVQYNLL